MGTLISDNVPLASRFCFAVRRDNARIQGLFTVHTVRIRLELLGRARPGSNEVASLTVGCI